MADTIELTIARDTYTELGILPAGMTVLAQPNEDYTTWVVEMSLPRAAGIAHPLPLPTSALGASAFRTLYALDDERCARHDYAFAREVLGLNNQSALRWIMRGYCKT
ncbi:hypothetical protein ACFXOQ_37525, partial [Streptomyces californicus]